MKSIPSARKAPGSFPSFSTPAPPAQASPASESPGLSQERIADRASSTTQVLREILGTDAKKYYVRHWGINE